MREGYIIGKIFLPPTIGGHNAPQDKITFGYSKITIIPQGKLPWGVLCPLQRGLEAQLYIISLKPPVISLSCKSVVAG